MNWKVIFDDLCINFWQLSQIVQKVHFVTFLIDDNDDNHFHKFFNVPMYEIQIQHIRNRYRHRKYNRNEKSILCFHTFIVKLINSVLT